MGLVRGLEGVVGGVGGGGKGEVDVAGAVLEGLEEEGHAGQGARGGEVAGLQGALFLVEEGAGHGEGGPGVEDGCGLFERLSVRCVERKAGGEEEEKGRAGWPSRTSLPYGGQMERTSEAGRP